jgi:hypothetical protein
MRAPLAWALAALVGAAMAGAAVGCGTPPVPATPAPDGAATTGAIFGVVRDRISGEPLSFATVIASPAAGSPASDRADTTDSAGGFRLAQLPPGEYEVMVYYAELALRWQYAIVGAGEEIRMDIVIDTTSGAAAPESPGAPANVPAAAATRARGSIDGTVVDERTREPIEGAVVTVTSPRLRDALMAVSDSAGKYRVHGVPPDTYTVSVFYSLIDYGQIEFRRTGVGVGRGQTAIVPILLDTNVQAAPR